jgi:phosphonate transport system permease protein
LTLSLLIGGKMKSAKKIKKVSIIITVFLVCIWVIDGTGVSLRVFLKGFPRITEFIKLLFPPDFSIVGRVFVKIIETFQIALVGGTLGALLAFPLSLFASRNIVSNKFIYQAVRTIFDIFRGIHEIVWALIFVSIVGLGPFPGVLAITIHVTGALGRYFSEAVETVNQEVIGTILAAGANKFQAVIRGIVPELKPLFLGYYLYYLEHNFRASTVLGVVGAGGIGMELIISIRLLKYHELSTILIMMVASIIVLDRLSAKIRKRVMYKEDFK